MSADERERNWNLKRRLEDFALRIIRLYTSLPNRGDAQVLGRQILKSGTSPGAHYRESQWAKSDADLINKIEGGLQELEETRYWLSLLLRSGIMNERCFAPLDQEASELIAIFVTIVRKVKGRRKRK